MIKNKLNFTFSVVTIILCLGVSYFGIPLALAGGGGSTSGGSSSSGCNSCTNGGTYATTNSRPTANQLASNLNSNPNSMGTNMQAVVTSNSNGTVSVSIRERDTGGNGNSSSGNPPPGGGPGLPPSFFSQPATGYFDSAISSTCRVTGWAYDPDNAAAVIAVHVYQDGRAGVGRYVTSCQANQSRPDVNSIIRIPGNHGFDCTLPASFMNTGSHALFIHAIDINGTPNNLLRTNGKTINCDGVIAPPPGGPGGPPGPPGPGGPGGPITVTPTPGTISVTAQSSVVRKLNTTTVRWQISNPIPVGYTCSLNGPGLVNIPITTQNGSRATQPIDSTSVFTVSCTNGTNPVSGEARIEIIPQVQEV